MRSNRAVTTACFGLLVWAAVAASACKVDVELGFPPDDGCDADGVPLDEGETLPDPDGCNSCTCSKGELVCTAMACEPCPPGDMPICTDMPVDDPSCFREAQCGPDGWQCVDNCPCGSGAMPDCPPPFPGCFYEGPFCDGIAWQCGPATCPSCEPEVICEQPPDPNCYVEPYCDDQLQWVCEEICPPCVDPPPVCDDFSTAECTETGWQCTGNALCGPDMIDCPASPFPLCTTYAECGQQGWMCQESCDPGYCPDKPPTCDPMGPANCSYYPMCSSQGWLCVETCV